MRKSAESLVELHRRPEPPIGMSARAREIWTEIVEDRPASWFRPGARAALRTFCETSAALETLDAEVFAHRATPDPQQTLFGEECDASELDDARLKLRDTLVRQQTQLLSRLRLCPVDDAANPRDAAMNAARHRAGTLNTLLGGKVTKLEPPRHKD